MAVTGASDAARNSRGTLCRSGTAVTGSGTTLDVTTNLSFTTAFAEVLARHGYNIDRRKIHLEEPIKQLGDHKVPIRLHREVTVEVTVQVVKED